MIKIYKGWIVNIDYLLDEDKIEDDKDYINLNIDNWSIFEDIREDCEKYGNYIRLEYFVSEKEINEENIDEELVGTLFGIANIELVTRGCPTCGYWEELRECSVGDHNLYEILEKYEGNYVLLKIEFLERTAKKV